MRPSVYAIGTLIGIVSLVLMIFSAPWNVVSNLAASQLQMIWFAIILVIISSLLRSARTRTILNFGKKGTLISHFQSLAAGSLVNAVVPLRLGELLRSYLLARKLGISFGFTFVAVALERLLDVMLVMTLFLAAIWATSTPWAAPFFIWNSVVALTFAAVTTLFLVMSIRQNKLLLRALWKLTMFLNSHLSVRLKMSFWTLAHGFQSFTRNIGAISAYVALAIGSWILNILAVGIVFLSLKGPTSLAATLSPFIAPEFLFRLSSVDSLLDVMRRNLVYFNLDTTASALEVVSVTWMVLNLPLAIMGFIALLIPKTYSKASARVLEEHNSTSRAQASELEVFLDSFFRREELADAVHGLTVDGSVTPIRFFKGGSNALTLLTDIDGEVVVRKIVSKTHQEKLREQYIWLRQFGNLTYVATPVRELKTGDSYMFDLEFVDSEGMFSWIHRVPSSLAKSRIRRLLASLGQDIYVTIPGPASLNKRVREEVISDYLQTWIFGRLVVLEEASPELAEIINCPHIYINGEKHRGLRHLLDLINNDPKCRENLADYRPTVAIHGDLTIDNMIVDSSGEIVVIDPDKNSITSPVIDFSRLLQSLEGGYEFLNQLQDGEVKSERKEQTQPWFISYPIRTSVAYHSLASTVREVARNELSASEYSTIDLHIGLFFVRMLIHRLRISPSTTPAYIATAIFFLERFTSKNGIL